MDYASGEYATKCEYGYGRLEASIKATDVSGTVTGLFIYDDPTHSGKYNNEIDIELLGKDTSHMQANYFTNGIGHPQWIDLRDKLKDPEFNTSNKFHIYGFIWSEDIIRWYVDDVQVCEVANEEFKASHPRAGQIILNLWPWKAKFGDISNWGGQFEYNHPIHSYFKDILYSPI